MKRTRTISCLILALLAYFSVSAQTVPAELDATLKATLETMRAQLNAKSLSAAMQFSDGAIWAHANGVSSEVPLKNVTPDHTYLIGSVTKTLTSACILQLADEGALNLDDSLHQWLDTFPFIEPNITIRQLMQHTSGIHDVLATPGQQDSLLADISRIWTAKELIDAFIQPADFQPGTGWGYSNTNYFLLGMIIKKATNNDFYTELRNRFYQPLGLSSFSIPAFEPSSGLPVAHVWMNLTADNILDDGHFFYSNWLSLNSTAGAAGGYYSTPTDCTKWMRTYMRGDLLSAEMMANAKTTVFAAGSQGGLYGLGLMKNNFLGFEAYGHGGDLAYHASSWYFPEKDLSITVFTNDSNADSWDLLPVVRELLRDCDDFEQITAVKPSLDGIGAAINVFPNPFDDQLSVNIQLANPAATVEMRLSNAIGQTVKTMQFENLPSGETTLKMHDLEQTAPGFYSLAVSVNGVAGRAIKLVK